MQRRAPGAEGSLNMQIKTTLEDCGAKIVIDVTPYKVRPGHHVRLSMSGANGVEATALLDDETRHAIIALLSLVPDTPKD